MSKTTDAVIDKMNESYTGQPGSNYDGFEIIESNIEPLEVIDDLESGQKQDIDKDKVCSTVKELLRRIKDSDIPGAIIWCTRDVLKEYNTRNKTAGNIEFKAIEPFGFNLPSDYSTSAGMEQEYLEKLQAIKAILSAPIMRDNGASKLFSIGVLLEEIPDGQS